MVQGWDGEEMGNPGREPLGGAFMPAFVMQVDDRGDRVITSAVCMACTFGRLDPDGKCESWRCAHHKMILESGLGRYWR